MKRAKPHFLKLLHIGEQK
ncbi:hypothetical protein Patl1_09879 [Pistacia atlantica]|uniref:Uncharacterized protein n=1 Tax=Pistacia atlantica TaxID=434234 RepID=A0ACC1A6E9_9ROSI|nr:hypothetical protein Patl1_09879 [Pistacia atlantica]